MFILGLMRKLLFVPLFISLIFLSGCSTGISSSEKLACSALYTSWQKVDFYESQNFGDLYSTSGVSQLGDNSESSEILGRNSRMADAIRVGLQEGDDDDLRQLATTHSLKWTSASNDGLTLMRSLIGTAKDGKTQLNDIQMSLLTNASVDIVDAGNLAIKMRTRCIEIGYKG